MSRYSAVILGLMLIVACQGQQGEAPERLEYAIAIHGGAGSMPHLEDSGAKRVYEEGLREALVSGTEMLEAGESALDVVERVVTILEDHPAFNAGRGAVFNHRGRIELDASIMDGSTLACGAVAAVSTVKNPILVARKVMEETDHVLLGSVGAEEFALELGFPPVSQDYFWTERRHRQWLDRMKDDTPRGTVGAVVLDRLGNLAAGTSTGGLTGKRYGRIGDSPIIGAGTYADNRTCAVSCTGRGEEFIRRSIAHSVSAMIDHGGMSLEEAASRAIHELLEPGTGGLIAVGRDGSIAMPFNTKGMLRAAADSRGRFEIAIRESEVDPE